MGKEKTFLPHVIVAVGRRQRRDNDLREKKKTRREERKEMEHDLLQRRRIVPRLYAKAIHTRDGYILHPTLRGN